ncbi:MAG: D-alanyl-D-alanine carboxypeptidase family protein [Selenomonadaceae bacterium]
MKLVQRVVLLLGIVFLLQSTVVAQATAVDSLTADAAILIEASTGKVLFEKNADKREYPASTTKMMTLLLALENCNLNDIVKVKADAAAVGGSSMKLETGDEIQMGELLQGMMLASGNDATVAVADYMTSSMGDFTATMNKKAKELGATNTNFVNSSGLPDINHYSTARDLSKIAAYGYRNPTFRSIVSVKEKNIQWVKPAKKHFTFENTNELLKEDDNINGIKTGYTRAAGECLVASSERNGVNLIAVVLHANDGCRFTEAETLLDYGFTKVSMEKAFSKNELVKPVYVRGGKGYKITARPQKHICYPVSDGDKKRYSVKYDMPNFVDAPVSAGQRVGALCILYNGKEVDRVDMVADSSMGKGFSLMSFIIQIYDGIFNGLNL